MVVCLMLGGFGQVPYSIKLLYREIKVYELSVNITYESMYELLIEKGRDRDNQIYLVTNKGN